MSEERSRREFITAIAASAAVPLASPVAWGQTPSPSPSPSPTLSPSLTPVPEAPSSVAEALTEVARIRWGKHLSGEQLGEIAKALDGRLRGAEAMKKVPLTNADEPDVVFFAEMTGGR